CCPDTPCPGIREALNGFTRQRCLPLSTTAVNRDQARATIAGEQVTKLLQFIDAPLKCSLSTRKRTDLDRGLMLIDTGCALKSRETLGGLRERCIEHRYTNDPGMLTIGKRPPRLQHPLFNEDSPTHLATQ